MNVLWLCQNGASQGNACDNLHTPSLVEERDHPVVAIDTDQLPVPDPLGGNPESEHRRDVVLAGDDRTMGEDAADIGDQPLGL